MKTIKKFVMVALIATVSLSAGAQQVNTLFFLENAPMRHTINPAFQPVSKGYINFTPLGWSMYSFGNNTYTLSDFFLKDPTDPNKTITVMHPNAKDFRANFIKSLPAMTLVSGEFNIGFLNLGVRIKDDGFLTIGLNQRIQMANTMPKSMLSTIIGGTLDLTNTDLDMNGMSFGIQSFHEIGVGYSHRINDQWTVGGKAKLLLGQIYTNINGKNMNISASTDKWNMTGNLNLDVAAPINMNVITSLFGGCSITEVIDMINMGQIAISDLFDGNDILQITKKVLTPTGYGAAFDIGMTYKPIPQVQISAAINDLGFIYWTNATRFNANMNSTFTGVGDININDPAYKDENGNFAIDKVAEAAVDKLKGILDGIVLDNGTKTGTAKMTTARMNIGVDANFWDNRVGVGVLSGTRLYNARLYEELTFGASFRPVNWFNIAASYSLLENGKYSNIGAGLSFMPYDGINITFVMDYIPTSYAAVNIDGMPKYVVPNRTKSYNVALGFSICWGTNHTDKDRDGVYDKLDMCPNTPRGVVVDEQGCPVDEDHDGVPDYLDMCLGTPEAAHGMIDSVGCPLDTDGDGVPDYLDKCPDTPAEATVDSVGCPLDTDGDGVPDYKDECPNTPAEAKGTIDDKGCPIDSDLDGVPDYLDKCPNTPAEAEVDADGCPIDSDGDGVPDYMDECPETPMAAVGFVDAKGCELDSDGDGVPDYMDKCPVVAGTKENNGCPEVKREVRRLLQKAMQGIEFESGKATIKKKSYPMLDQIATIFIENTSYIIEVQGHTDNVGKKELNQKVSQQRAEAVMTYLINKGVPASRLSAKGYGDEVPVADNKTAAGRQKNRRVEFNIHFEDVQIETVPTQPTQEVQQ